LTCQDLSRKRSSFSSKSNRRKRIKINASLRGDANSPSTFQLVSKFWQKTQRRLQPAKKMVPEPRQPRKQHSGPSEQAEINHNISLREFEEALEAAREAGLRRLDQRAVIRAMMA
jgi:hypothetical protein